MPKKVLIFNGSPRKNSNTAELLKMAQKGAQDAGAETEYIDLYDLNYTDCRSCLACKRKNIPEKCRCYWKDDLSLVLEKIYCCDVLIIGSPVYYGEPTGQVRSLLVRSTFPAMSYNDYSSVFAGKADAGIILTMNAGRHYYESVYEQKMKEYFAPLRFLNGSTEILACCDTLQVDDYSLYDMASFDEKHKRTVHEEKFPQDLQNAYDLGRKLCS